MVDKFYKGDVVEVINLDEYRTEEISFAMYRNRQRAKANDLIGQRFKVINVWANGWPLLGIAENYECPIEPERVIVYKRSLLNRVIHALYGR